MWKIAWNILPTKEWLGQLFHVNSDISCPLCKVADDSLQHLFFDCIFARVVWHHSFWPLDSTVSNFSSMLDWIKFYRNKAFHDGISLMLIMCQRILIKFLLSITKLGILCLWY
jgi:hypothetical protein